MKQIVATGILFLCLVSGAFASDIKVYDESFIGSEWHVTSFTYGSEMSPVLSDYPISLSFTPDGWVFGMAGCNQFSGSYELEEDMLLHIGPLLTTRMACEQDAMDQETAFIEAMSRVASYDAGEVFTLYDINGESIMVLESLSEIGDVPFTGTIWNLVAYGSEYNIPPEGTIPTVVFSDDGTIAGTSGCNSFFGQYQENGQELSISGIGSSLMLCIDDEVMQLEQEYLALLANVATYAIDASSLTLYNEAAESILFFEATPVLQVYNTPFELRSFLVDETIQYVVADSKITFEITEDGNVSGNAGCNTYSTSATLNEEDQSLITIAPAVSTMMLCFGEGIMEQESAYLAILPTAHSFDFDGRYLKLYDVNGDVIASFTIAEAETTKEAEA
ncbi:MAG: META domain-containing protein [Methanomicrobiales archaeon]|nr:META domain-containing protein [Methanomicrobiales archaeon]